MKVKFESAKVKHAPIWLVVDEKITIIPPIKGKDFRVTSAVSERSQRCNIAIIDYQSKEEAKIIANAISKALEKL